MGTVFVVTFFGFIFIPNAYRIPKYYYFQCFKYMDKFFLWFIAKKNIVVKINESQIIIQIRWILLITMLTEISMARSCYALTRIFLFLGCSDFWPTQVGTFHEELETVTSNQNYLWHMLLSGPIFIS